MGFINYVTDVSQIKWKRLARACATEFVTTGFLILFALLLQGGDLCTVGNVSLWIWVAGPVSGGHLNPWVSLLLAIQQQITILTSVLYIICQIAGACLGSAVAIWVRETSPLTNGHNATTSQFGVLNLKLTSEEDLAVCFVLEALAALIFYLTLLSITDSRREQPPVTYLGPFLLGLSTIPGTALCKGVTYGCVNPVRALGPAIVNNNGKDLYIFVLATLAGALVANLLYLCLYDNLLSREWVTNYCSYQVPTTDPAMKPSNSTDTLYPDKDESIDYSHYNYQIK
ncbi:aquaporin-like protein [Cichlidogyrus casuarinus]|uniref:Aquaporin-like protein n=1 Tax=Cichlidogyrus casuarinus TaxID=1844966 RepID=A0ABD2PYS0_9PLAT